MSFVEHFFWTFIMCSLFFVEDTNKWIYVWPKHLFNVFCWTFFLNIYQLLISFVKYFFWTFIICSYLLIWMKSCITKPFVQYLLLNTFSMNFSLHTFSYILLSTYFLFTHIFFNIYIFLKHHTYRGIKKYFWVN